MTAHAAGGHAVVISADWPGKHGGGRLCTLSDLRAIAKSFQHTHFVYVGPPFDATSRPEERLPASVKIANLARVPPSTLISFIGSLRSRCPAVAYRYRRVGPQLELVLEAVSRSAGNRPVHVIFEDVPTAALLPRVWHQLPMARVAIRSQNVLATAFSGIERRANPVARRLWRFEQARMRSFETFYCRRVDRLWAITEAEAETYRSLLGLNVHGVLGVGLDAQPYAEIPLGHPHTVVHLGRLDLRKGRDLIHFLHQGWPLVRQAESRARLLLGGSGSELLADEPVGIFGHGIVPEDRELLRCGSIFINPQMVGAGLQVKNAVAMIAGKALITTPMAAKGLNGVDGEHYVIARSPETMATRILELMADEQRLQEIGRRGRLLAMRSFEQQVVERRALSLLKDFVSVSARSPRGATEEPLQ